MYLYTWFISQHTLDRMNSLLSITQSILDTNQSWHAFVLRFLYLAFVHVPANESHSPLHANNVSKWCWYDPKLIVNTRQINEYLHLLGKLTSKCSITDKNKAKLCNTNTTSDANYNQTTILARSKRSNNQHRISCILQVMHST